MTPERNNAPEDKKDQTGDPPILTPTPGFSSLPVSWGNVLGAHGAEH